MSKADVERKEKKRAEFEAARFKKNLSYSKNLNVWILAICKNISSVFSDGKGAEKEENQKK